MRKYRGLTRSGMLVCGWYKEDTYGKPKILAEDPDTHFLCWFFVIPETVEINVCERWFGEKELSDIVKKGIDKEVKE